MTKVPRRTAASASKLIEPFRRFREYKTLEATAKAEHEKLRDTVLMPALAAAGKPYGEQGQHLAIELPEPIDGYTRLVRRANNSRSIDVDAAEKMLKKKGVLGQAQIATITITGITADQVDALLSDLERLKLEKKYGVLPDCRTVFSQEAMYAIYQRQRQELEAREAAGEKIGVRERSKYISEAELDGLIVTETTYAFHPEK